VNSEFQTTDTFFLKYLYSQFWIISYWRNDHNDPFQKKKKRIGIIDIIYLFIFTSILICIIDIISFIAKNRIDLTI
jgi:hypothetical protein